MELDALHIALLTLLDAIDLTDVTALANERFDILEKLGYEVTFGD